jgi:TolA-binding protein
VEVRGTSFRVTAGAGRLEEVRVWRGHVEVRSAAGGVTALGAGDSWSAEDTVAALEPRPRRAAERTRARASAREDAVRRAAGPPEAPAPAAPPAPSFHRAWVLLRAGDAIAAAEAFAEVQDASRGTALEADALYWRAVALSRAGERMTARELLELFLRRFASTARAGEAAVALGFLLVDLGQSAEARQAFARAEADPSERVRASARAGLDRLGAGR